MKPYKPILFLAAGLFVGTSLWAQSNDWGLPPSPNGKLASAFLDILQTNDMQAHEDFIEARYAPAFRNAMTMEQHLSQLDQLHHDLAGAQVNGLEMAMGSAMVLTLIMVTKEDAYHKLHLTIEQGDPPAIGGLNVEAMDGPPASEYLLEAVLNIINETDTAAREKFVATFFTQAFRDELPMQDHLDLLKGMHEKMAGAELLEANAMSTNMGSETLVLTLRAKDEKRYTVTFDIQDSSPPRLVTLSYKEAE